MLRGRGALARRAADVHRPVLRQLLEAALSAALVRRRLVDVLLVDHDVDLAFDEVQLAFEQLLFALLEELFLRFLLRHRLVQLLLA